MENPEIENGADIQSKDNSKASAIDFDEFPLKAEN